MKTILFYFLLLAVSASGQTGDFQLNNSQQRSTAGKLNRTSANVFAEDQRLIDFLKTF